jgi:hypothetical protein
MRRCLLSLGLLSAALCLSADPACGQGGPPLQTDDPGTPGNRNWEINVGVTADRMPESNTYETPIVDMNYGLGDRIQLKLEIPYLLVSNDSKPIQSGLGNSLAGVKWRFFEDKKHGLDISTYPQLEFSNPGSSSVRRGLVNSAPNFLLPVEVTKEAGPLELDGEAGYWFNSYTHDGYILGFAVGHHQTEKFELLSEIYQQVRVRGTERDTTFGLGGRYELHRDLLLLLMAGRSFHGPSSGQSQFIGYAGLQFQIDRSRPASVPEPQ